MGKSRARLNRLCIVSALVYLFLLSIPSFLSAQETQVDPYYQRMYREGVIAYQNGNYKDAAQKMELAIFGYNNANIRAKGAVYICLSHFHLNQFEQCERFFHKAEAYVRSHNLEALALEEDAKLAFAEIWNRFYPHEVIYRSRSQNDSTTPPTPAELKRQMYRLERQIKAVPNDIIAYYDLYQVYLQKQDRKKAKKTLEKMMKNNPGEIEGHYQIGMLEFRNKKYKSAVKNFEKFLEKAAENPVKDELLRGAWAYLILSYNFKGDKAKAQKLATEVADALTHEVVTSLDLQQRDSAVLRDILENTKKAN